jgi:predicted SAM-dependent methyltransferase
MMSKLPVAQVYVPEEEIKPIKLDIGCGKTKTDGVVGIDSIDFGQELVHDVRDGLPMYGDNSVESIQSSHFVEHLTGEERVAFFNECYRILKVGGICHVVTPCWSHSCAYGDPTHKWPPMSQWYPLYLNKVWREGNAPHTQYTCDFDYVLAGSWDQGIESRNQEYKTFAMNNWINNWRDLIVTFTKRNPVENTTP